MTKTMSLEAMMQQLRTVEMDLRERGHDGTVSAIHDLCDIVEALVIREAARVPLPMQGDPWPKPPAGPMLLKMVPRQVPTIADLTDAELDRFFPRGHGPHVGAYDRHRYTRREFEVYQPVPGQPWLYSIRRIMPR